MRNFASSIFSIISLFIIALPTGSTQGTIPCMENSIYNQMDFRLGSWELKSQEGLVYGIQSIEKILDGCAIKETFKSADGQRQGSSILFYDAQEELWKQTFADNLGNWTEGKGQVIEEKLIFEGRAARYPMIRWVITKISEGKLKGITEVSIDGHSWEILVQNTLERIEE